MNKRHLFELLANKILQYFVPGLLIVALISGVVVGLLCFSCTCFAIGYLRSCQCMPLRIEPHHTYGSENWHEKVI